MEELNREHEEYSRKVTQERLKGIVPRELLPNTAYAPLPGIYDIGWNEWTKLPAADFLKDLRREDDKFIKDHEEFALELAPMYNRGEFTLEQIKRVELEFFQVVDNFATNIARHAFDNLKNREVRDIILRHASEEIGHSELRADFMVYGLGMEREEVWESKPLIGGQKQWITMETEAIKKLRELSPPLAYAVIPFLERSLPKQNRLMAEGLRKHYRFPERVIGFFNLHTYVDIYHERFGLYVVGKYATTKELQDLFREAVMSRRESKVEHDSALYDAVRKVK